MVLSRVSLDADSPIRVNNAAIVMHIFCHALPGRTAWSRALSAICIKKFCFLSLFFWSTGMLFFVAER